MKRFVFKTDIRGYFCIFVRLSYFVFLEDAIHVNVKPLVEGLGMWFGRFV